MPKSRKVVPLHRKDLPSSKHKDEPGHSHDHGHDHSHHVHEEAATMLKLIQQLSNQNEELRQNYERLLSQTAKALMKTLELRDPYSYGHSVRVMEYAMMIGKGAGLVGQDMRNLEMAAMFHDIGKVGIPDCVLLKPARLTPEEQAVIMEHPVKSAEIIELIDEFRSAVAGVKHHHERFDGEGYPAKLSGMEIPLEARIILVADTFDAMTSNRPYRKALPIDVAYNELMRFSGVQFDPEFVKIFMREHQKLVTPQAPIRTTKKAA